MADLIVVVLDRLGAGWCGPYGATFVDTPFFNQLAAQSLTAEWLLSSSPRLDAWYDRIWRPNPDATSLPDLARQLCRAAHLICDEAEVSDRTDADALEHAPPISASLEDGLAATIGETRLAATAAAVAQQLGRDRAAAIRTVGDGPSLLWAHFQAMQGLWDAPYEERMAFVEHEDDPAPDDSAIPPERRLRPDDDPDVAFGACQKYAAQLQVADTCLDAAFGELLRVRGAQRAQPWLVATSPRGYPLGEHARIGPCDHALYSELVHVPLWVRPPGGLEAPKRSSALLSTEDVGGWLQSLLAANAPQAATMLADLESRSREAVVIRDGGQSAARTSHWYARQTDEQLELYVKPDDRWEANEISQRALDDADTLRELLNAANTPPDEEAR